MSRGSAAVRNLFLLSLLGLIGCAGMRSPGVAVDRVKPGVATEDALALDIVMELRNPNSAAVELHEFRYTVSINGTTVYTGRRSGGANLSPKSTRQLRIPAVVNFVSMGWTRERLPARCNYSLHGTVVYNAPSALAQILFDTGVRRPKVPFSSRGELSLE